MEKRNLLLVSGIMIILVVAIFGIVMFSSGEKGTDNNSDPGDIKFMKLTEFGETCDKCGNGGGSGALSSKYTEELILEGVVPISGNTGKSSSSKLMENGKDSESSVDLSQETLNPGSEEENQESEDKITKA